MMLKASVYLTLDHVALNLWTETGGPSDPPLVIRSVRHSYVDVPTHMKELPEAEQCLEALRWAVVTALHELRGQGRQPGS